MLNTRVRVLLNKALLGVFAALVLPGAQAWNESGHRIIAASAARQLPPELRVSVAAALQAHPRYDKDLAAYRPGTLVGLSDLEWLMGQAAQWPDRVRRFNNEPFYKRPGLVEKYHRGRWHYINLPVYLSKRDRSLRIKDPTAEINSKDPGNALEALTFLRLQLRDPDVSLETKGLWISWALHLIADVHQPLHTTAMFERNRWPKGDRGGNDVKIKGSGDGTDGRRLDSLHYYWDSAISTAREPMEIDRLVSVLAAEPLPPETEDEAEPLKWITEGKVLANELVYDPLRAQLRESPVVSINRKYSSRVETVALEQAALAARRTTRWLQDAMP